MAIKNFDNLTEALSSDGFLDRPDGWFWKQVDTGNVYHRVSGVWEPWGLGLAFAPPTKSGISVSDEDGNGEVVFGTPFVDDDYSVQMTCTEPNNERSIVMMVVTQDADGFTFKTRRATRLSQEFGNVTVAWLATRSYNE